MPSRPQIPRARRRLAWVALAACLLLLLPTLQVAATHNYGHRLYVIGRVIDAEGLPVAGAQMTVELRGLDLGAPERPGCFQNPCPTQTSATGDYQVLWHAHGIGRGGEAVVTVGNKTVTAQFDDDLRWTVVNVQLDEDVDQHDPQTVAQWNRTYTVAGRLWQARGGLPDAQTTWVDGDVLTRTRVNVTLVLPDGTELTESVTTDNYGDYRAQFAADEAFEAGTVRIEAAGTTDEVGVDATRRASIQATMIPPPPQEAADFTVPLIIVGGIGGAIALYFGGQKLKQKREVERARKKSSRKRANK